MFPVEEQDKTPGRNPMEMEINNLPDKEFKEKCSPNSDEEQKNTVRTSTKN